MSRAERRAQRDKIVALAEKLFPWSKCPQKLKDRSYVCTCCWCQRGRQHRDKRRDIASIAHDVPDLSMTDQ